MNKAHIIALAFSAMALLTGCNQANTEPPGGAVTQADSADAEPQLDAQAVPADLVAAPNTDFTAFEPSEVDIRAAEHVVTAIEPLLSSELGQGESLQASVHSSGANRIADVVRSGLADDSVAAAHVRVEFMPSPEGWFPINAYRRFQCRRGPNAGAWSPGPCP